MRTIDLIKANRYQDSVTLMQIAAAIRSLAGIEDAALVMGTDPNKELLRAAGLLTPEGQAAGPNHLIIALRGSEAGLAAAAEQVEHLLQPPPATSQARQRQAPRTLSAGLDALPQANLVLLSTPGLYAAAEARKALQQDRHVMIFSDNVSPDDELALKRQAARRGLLLMGPDCGTAIIGGVPLGFANVVRRGNIGIVGASGTGIQEVTVLIDRYGQGISHAVGTGSRDLTAEIGALATLSAFSALQHDPSTQVIVIVSKPPHPTVAARVLAEVARSSKPVVIAFIGADSAELSGRLRLPAQPSAPPPATVVATLEEAARRAVELAGGNAPATRQLAIETISSAIGRLAPPQQYVRGLFSGGTLCYEAQLILARHLGAVASNAPLRAELRLADVSRSRQHTCLDLGADELTIGRPHPMIDPTLRQARIAQEAADPEVAVLLLDVVLGYGAHPDPAGALAPAIEAARAQATAAGRSLAVIASICGTPGDPQGFETQRRRLLQAGVILAPSNAAAARLAAAIAARTPALAVAQ